MPKKIIIPFFNNHNFKIEKLDVDRSVKVLSSFHRTKRRKNINEIIAICTGYHHTGYLISYKTLNTA